MNHFSIGLWHVMKSGLYKTTGNDQLSGWTKKKLQSTSQSQNCIQNRSHGHCWWSAAALIHYNFLNLAETITSEKYPQHINEMHWKLQRLQLTLIHGMGPILPHDNAWPHVVQPRLQKLNESGYEVLPHLLYSSVVVLLLSRVRQYSPDLSPTDYHFFKLLNNFLCGKHFLNQQEVEKPFQCSLNPKALISML